LNDRLTGWRRAYQAACSTWHEYSNEAAVGKISARGFGGNPQAQNFSNKLLMLIDGRRTRTRRRFRAISIAPTNSSSIPTHLTKPVDPDRLGTLIHELLRA